MVDLVEFQGFNIIKGDKLTNTIGYIETESGTVFFEMNNGNFEIKLPDNTFHVYDEDLKEIDGKFFFDLPEDRISCFWKTKTIEIPADVLERKEEYLKEIENSRGSIGSTETNQGKVYFYLTAEGMIKAKLGELEETTDTFYTVENQRNVFLHGLGLDIPFVVIPEGVEKAYNQVKWNREQKNKYLVYAGRSLLTGKDYYRFSCDISQDTLNRAQGKFEYFEPGDLGTLEGWLTSDPEKVEEYLRIRNPISSRKAEIDKQKEQAVKTNKKLIEKLMKAA